MCTLTLLVIVKDLFLCWARFGGGGSRFSFVLYVVVGYYTYIIHSLSSYVVGYKIRIRIFNRIQCCKGVALPDLLVFLLALQHVQHSIKSGEELLEGGAQAAQRLVHHRPLLVAEDQLLAQDGQELVTNVCNEFV